MSANEIEGTTLVLAVNVALVAPAGTVTLGGTVTCAGLLLDSVTTAPPSGAGARKSTVPVAGVPPSTVRPKSNWLSTGNTMVSAFTRKPFKVALTLTDCPVVTWLAVAVKVALVAPSGTVTLAGTVTAVGSLEFNASMASATTAPPTGAGAYSVTVPVKESPVTTAPVPTPRVESSLNLITVRTGLTGSPATPETPVPGISAVVHRLSGIDNAGTLAVKLALV